MERSGTSTLGVHAGTRQNRSISPLCLHINVFACLLGVDQKGFAQQDGLPGIGPVLAQRIVDEREANGPYTGAEDLTRVEGIGQAIVESIQDHIITEDTQE